MAELTPEQQRARIEEAIYAKIQSDQSEDPSETPGVPFLLGWAVVYEFTSGELDDRGQTGAGVILPLTQGRATSRGLFSFGSDKFTS